MLNIKLKKLSPTAKIPQKMSTHAAGYDLYSCNEKEIILKRNEIKLISTGIAISIPPGYEAQIRPRSGLAVKNGIGVLNSPGTIDADYRGEIKVILFNFSTKDFQIKPEMRIAQIIFSKHEAVNFTLTLELDETDRGEGGFGHTST
ncbi:MAG: deoxyuridine 5'-triphosphate nucleotidohydrolase [Candidatus Cloacimonas sp. SDB]|nr:MAG: deoxyuridine 5'-triphosphate nucleotidohydrolase [Candidatus Cloacimonas sp. SDB]